MRKRPHRCLHQMKEAQGRNDELRNLQLNNSEAEEHVHSIDLFFHYLTLERLVERTAQLTLQRELRG